MQEITYLVNGINDNTKCTMCKKELSIGDLYTEVRDINNIIYSICSQCYQTMLER